MCGCTGGKPARVAAAATRYRLAGQCLAAFRDEEPGESVRSSGQVTFDRAEFVTRDRLFDSQTILETPDPDTSLIEARSMSSRRRPVASLTRRPWWYIISTSR
jgi:hypothetical protein